MFNKVNLKRLRNQVELKGILLFDIDGVIRDVSNSYRLAIKKTVHKFCDWEPSLNDIDNLKQEGCWNNDWEATLELIKRYCSKNQTERDIPSLERVIKRFNDYYFGGRPTKESIRWTGFINNEPLLVDKSIFKELSDRMIAWGFVSGAEPPSAKYVLEERLGLISPPLIAMGDAPDKPDPTGLLKLVERISKDMSVPESAPIAYIGDTVADVITVMRAKELVPNKQFISLAICPPHIQSNKDSFIRVDYEKSLVEAGADKILASTEEVVNVLDYF